MPQGCLSPPASIHDPQPLPLAPLFQVFVPMQPLNRDEASRAGRRRGVLLVAVRVLRPRTTRRGSLLDQFES